MEKKYIKWTSTLCHEVCKIMSAYTDNLAYGFEEVEKHLRIPAKTVRTNWYNPQTHLYKYRTTNHTIGLITFNSIYLDRKNNCRRNGKYISTAIPLKISEIPKFVVSWLTNLMNLFRRNPKHSNEPKQ